MLGTIERFKIWDWDFVALVKDTTIETQWYILLSIVVVYIRLLGQFQTFFFFYDKISQAPKSIKKNTRH